MPETICLAEPISPVKLAVLQAYAEGRAPTPEQRLGPRGSHGAADVRGRSTRARGCTRAALREAASRYPC